MDLQLCCLWQPASEGARLVRVLGETPCPVLPQALAGHTVAEIGPYCFAPVLRGVSGPVFATMGSATREFSDTAGRIGPARNSRKLCAEHIPARRGAAAE